MYPVIYHYSTQNLQGVLDKDLSSPVRAESTCDGQSESRVKQTNVNNQTTESISGSSETDTVSSKSQESDESDDTESKEESSSDVSSIDLDAFLGPPQPSEYPPSFPSFKLVGDNIDKEVQPREMRNDSQTKSLHYFHSYAVRDRINLANVSDVAITPELSEVDLTKILPTPEDDEALIYTYSLLVFRVLKKHMSHFAKFGRDVERHVQHEFSFEMAQQSIAVSGCTCSSYIDYYK